MRQAYLWVAINELEYDGTVLVLDAVRPVGTSQFVRDEARQNFDRPDRTIAGRLFLLEGDDLPPECEVSPGQSDQRSVTVTWRGTTPVFHLAP